MVKRENMYIQNYTGVLLYNETPLLYFKIEDKKLMNYQILKKDMILFPCELVKLGISYYSLNLFFRDRVVLDGTQFIREYLNSLGLVHYNFEDIVKKNSGRNYLDNWWVDTEVSKYSRKLKFI